MKNKAELKSWFEDDKLYDGEYVKHKISQPDEPEVLSHELPVIPGYVAEWIDTNKEKYDLVQLFWEIGEGGLVNLDVDRWIEENPHTFARAWLDGYEVEEEQKYVLPVGGNHALCKFANDAWGIYKEDTDKLYLDDDFKFTEREIKDYDERFWPFAVKVEELEE